MTAVMTGFDGPQDNEDERRAWRENLNELCKIELGISLVQFIDDWSNGIDIVSDNVLEMRGRIPDSWFR